MPVGDHLKGVDRPGIGMQLHRHAIGDQPPRVVEVFVEKQIEAAGADPGLRQAGKGFGAAG